MFSGRSIGAFFLACLQALNISAHSSFVESPGYELVDYLTNPYGIVDNSINYVFGDDRVETDNEFLERSTIKIDKDVVTIDGVPYSNVWLSHDAAEQFRTEGWDLATAFNLTSENEGTFAEGTGTIGGVPYYLLNGTYRTPQFIAPVSNVTYRTGDFTYYWTVDGWGYRTNYVKLDRQQNYTSGASNQLNPSAPNAFQVINRQAEFGEKYSGGQGIYRGTTFFCDQSDIDMEPFDFSWTTGELPADIALQQDVGLNIQVPTSVINNFYIQYPDYDLPNVEIPMVDVDPSLIDDLILPLIPIINTGDANIEFAEHGQPTPPAPGTIANEPWESLRRALQDIKESIQQGTTIQQTIKAGQDIIAQLISPINTTLQTISNNISDIIDKIETGSIDFYRDTIRSIRTPFTRWFGLLAQNLGIWHYVVEWLQYISAPFSWFWNVFTHVNPILISPVYAMFAATLVIAIYRRFGR